MKKSLLSLSAATLALSTFLLANPATTSAAPKADLSSISLSWSKTLNDPNLPIAESSPTLAHLPDPSVVVGDRAGNVYAYNIASGNTVPGWPVRLGATNPIDSPLSATKLSPTASADTVYVGVGTDGTPSTPIGYLAINANGTTRWSHTALDTEPAGQNVHGVIAGITLVPTGSSQMAVAGSTGQVMHAFGANRGAESWSFLTADSVHSAAAYAPTGKNGTTEVILGGDSTSSHGIPIGNPPFVYQDGGHLRFFSLTGQKRCEIPQPNQTLDSSPAVGPILPKGKLGVVIGTGSYYPGASDTGKLIIANRSCQIVSRLSVGGVTYASPALAKLDGTHTAIIEIASKGSSSPGKLVAFDTSGAMLPGYPKSTTAAVVGPASPVTADLFNTGNQDIIVPTLAGLDIFDGPTGSLIGVLANYHAFQSTPMVTFDQSSQTLSITAAGYTASTQCPTNQSICLRGTIDHFIAHEATSLPTSPDQSWPMFHHDSTLSGSQLAPLTQS